MHIHINNLVTWLLLYPKFYNDVEHVKNVIIDKLPVFLTIGYFISSKGGSFEECTPYYLS